MGGPSEDRGRRTLLDDPPGVHHGDTIGETGDHRKVVGDVQRGDAVLAAQVTHSRQHVCLRAHVEPGRRLVQHDHRRPAGERHRQPDALLLPAGKLVRVAAKELRSRWQEHLGHALADALAPGLIGAAEVVMLEHFQQLRADAQRRVEGSARVLGDVADEVAAGPPQAGHLETEHLPIVDRDRAVGDRHALAGVPEHGQPDGGLSRTGFADESEHLTGLDFEEHLVDDVVAAGGGVDPQGVDHECRHQSARPRSMPAAARAMPSVISPVPIVNTAMAMAGSSVPHGCTDRAPRFCCTINPQSAALTRRGEPEEAERGDDEQRVGQPQVGLDEQRSGDVGEQLAAQDREDVTHPAPRPPR